MSSISEALQSRRAPNDRIETQPHSSLAQASSEATLSEYGAAVSLIILEVCTLFDLPLPESEPPAPDSPSEMDLKIGVWTSALVRTVPLDDLRPALDFTIDHHEKEHPINAMDIKRGYGRMLIGREQARRAESDHCRNETLPDCADCAGERIREIWLPSLNEAVTLPCEGCRPRAFRIAREQWLERRGVKAAGGSVAMVAQAAKILESQAEN
jgi:hypothetical protein